jgi:hypothetical protein
MLFPDVHVCVIAEAQVVDGVPAALRISQLRILSSELRETQRPLTFVSGPSATPTLAGRKAMCLPQTCCASGLPTRRWAAQTTSPGAQTKPVSDTGFGQGPNCNDFVTTRPS